VCLTEQTRII